MDGNKDEALKYIGIAKEAIASGKKERALKFIRIAQRLNSTLSLDDLIAACEKIDSSASGPSENGSRGDKSETGVASGAKSAEGLNGERTYTEEHVKLIKQITKNMDYYQKTLYEGVSLLNEMK